jgi:hypothetical protein
MFDMEVANFSFGSYSTRLINSGIAHLQVWKHAMNSRSSSTSKSRTLVIPSINSANLLLPRKLPGARPGRFRHRMAKDEVLRIKAQNCIHVTAPEGIKNS